MSAIAATRPGLLRRALRLEYLTIGWNIIEGLVAIGAALAAGSVALLGFGIDSFVESASVRIAELARPVGIRGRGLPRDGRGGRLAAAA